jgi:hypothetical protein
VIIRFTGRPERPLLPVLLLITDFIRSTWPTKITAEAEWGRDRSGRFVNAAHFGHYALHVETPAKPVSVLIDEKCGSVCCTARAARQLRQEIRLPNKAHGECLS